MNYFVIKNLMKPFYSIYWYMINNLGYYIMISNQIEEESTGSNSISIKSIPKSLIEFPYKVKHYLPIGVAEW